MCGIAGILRVHPAGADVPPHLAAIPEPWLDLLDTSIKHRGPDGQGRFRDRVTRPDGATVDVALVHRRLSIIDHAGGAQPMVSIKGAPSASPGRATTHARPPDRAGAPDQLPLLFHGPPNDLVVYGPIAPADDLVAVVFNGCIYNHRELRKELQAAGHAFQTDHSDTEVLLHGWREWGTALPERLEGMFAFAVWDPRTTRLFIARDHYGEKPLFTLDGLVFELDTTSTIITPGPPFARPPRPGDALVFASTFTALHRLQHAAQVQDTDYDTPEEAAENNAARLGWWLSRGYDQFPPSRAGHEQQPSTSITAGDERLLPSGRFVEEQASRWWQFDPPGLRANPAPWFGGRTPPAPGRLSPGAVEPLLRRAVAARVEADVPLGCFLSGGVDSSLVALFAKEAIGSLRTFSVRMPDARYDESPWAEHVARLIGTRHATLDCRADPGPDLVRLITQLGLPFGDSSLLPTYWVSRAAREHVKVALTGDGGDELFAGYERHEAIGIARRWGWLISLLPVWPLPASDPKSRPAKLRRLILALRAGGLEELSAIFMTAQIARLGRGTHLRPEVRDWNPLAASLLWMVVGMSRSDLWLQLGMGLRHLSFDLLKKVDTAAMSVALETRAPFLDSELAAAVHSANPLDLMPSGQRKGLLRQLARQHLPADIVDRPKMGFAIPIGEWFRTDYGGMRQLLRDHLEGPEPFGPPSLGIELNMAFIRRMLKEHDDAGKSSVFPWKGRDHSQRLYMLLVLSIWAKWLGSLGSAAPVDAASAAPTVRTP